MRKQPNAAHLAAEEINRLLAGMPTVAALAVLYEATAGKLRELGAQAVPGKFFYFKAERVNSFVA